MTFSKTIQMYIFDGNPNGRIMCELSNWNGRVYKVSRNEISEFSKREDAENTGVYFLFGKDENNVDTIYIGEAEKMLTRIKQHLKDTVYWNNCILVVSKDNLLNKAHVKFLENKFYLIAKDSGRAVVINSTIPTRSSISEYDEAMLEEFISNTKLLVNTLGYKVFDTIEESTIKNEDNSMNFSITTTKGVKANGLLVADGFVVLAGSIVTNSTVPSMSPNLKKLRDNLFTKEIINKDNVFNQDHIFTSPSLAAATVLGRNANGRTEWKTQDQKSIKDLEENNK
jgi:hypothetical protein